MKRLIISWVLAMLIGFSACDDGKIYEENHIASTEGFPLRMTGSVSGIDSWPEGYSVVIAGFGDSQYATISKNVPAPSGDSGEVDVVMSNISENVKTVELCVINRLRKRIITLSSYSLEGVPADTVRMEVGIVDAGMYGAVQENVFNAYCISCHGASTQAAAGLHLTAGLSYEALVNKTADLDSEGRMFVEPGNASNSFLHDVLRTDITANWRMDHIEMITDSDVLDLLDNWINNGAKE